jgi:hypothetical protein
VGLFGGFQAITEAASFLGLLAGLFHRPLGRFQAISKRVSPVPLAGKCLLSLIGSTVGLGESGHGHGHQPLVIGSEVVALGGDGLFGANDSSICGLGPSLRGIGTGALASKLLLGTIRASFGLVRPHICRRQLLTQYRNGVL